MTAEELDALARWFDAHAVLREKLDVLGRQLGGAWRLRLDALVAAGNVGGRGEREAVAAYLDDPDSTTRELATWAFPLEERDAVA